MEYVKIVGKGFKNNQNNNKYAKSAENQRNSML